MATKKQPQMNDKNTTNFLSTGDDLPIRMHQVSDEKVDGSHDVGFVLWPSAVLLAKYVRDHSELIIDIPPGDILELGAGCGLVGTTVAVMLFQQEKSTTTLNASTKVILTDYNPTVLKNLERNIRLNNHQLNEESISVAGLDFFDQTTDHDNGGWTDIQGNKRRPVRLILAADVVCYSNDATLLATTIQSALMEGGQALVMGPGEDQRFGLKDFANACTGLGLEVQVTTGMVTSDHDGTSGDTLTDVMQTGGYSHDYDFTMFTVDKPITSGTTTSTVA